MKEGKKTKKREEGFWEDILEEKEEDRTTFSDGHNYALSEYP